LTEKNLPVDENLVTTEPLTMETGGKEALRIRDMADRPTAILTGNDLVAIGFLRKCHEIGLRIPQDISVVGMDDIPAASMVSPSLTTIRKPQREIGEHAAHIVMDMIAEKKVASRTLACRGYCGTGNSEGVAMKRSFRILSPCGILGYGFPDASFQHGLEMKPDAIVVDAGSTDAWPS
jgi:hypothetical protein